jgi:hypothetical protein
MKRFQVELCLGLVCLPLVITLAAACAAPSVAGSGSANHACADKVAVVAVTGSTPGLWNCLSETLQTTMHAIGHDGDGALIQTPFAGSWHYLGHGSDYAIYELVLLPEVAAQAGAKTVPLTVWVDAKGKVLNVGIASGIY